MKILRCEQGSLEWQMARLGIPTGSQVNRILTPAKLKVSSSAHQYLAELAAEWLVGYPLEFGGNSQYMERGKEQEPEARAWYELTRDVEVEQVGFIMTDDELFGCSPDGLVVGRSRGLEIKCPALHTHIGYLRNPQLLEDEYHGQVQSNMYVSERDEWDLVSYHPDLPKVVRTIGRDEAFIKALDAALGWFKGELLSLREQLRPHRRVQEAA